jgi:hypothetical protein
MAELYPFLFPLGSGLLSGLILFYLSRAGWRGLAIAAIAAMAFTAVVTILRARDMDGMEGLGTMLIAVLFLLPATLGGIIGTLIGAWQSRRQGGDGID